jgi:DNA-directed RNA polymerase specialized sigma24 family protein
MNEKRQKLLKRFRELHGTFKRRTVLMLAEVKASGAKITCAELLAELRDARSEITAEKHARILAVLARGRSIRETARLLNIPFTTIASVKTRTARKAEKKK